MTAGDWLEHPAAADTAATTPLIPTVGCGAALDAVAVTASTFSSLPTET
jgi:hypothetical protein